MPLIHPTRRHPLTGLPLQAVGVLPNGRVIWPILGGDDTIPPAGQQPPPAATGQQAAPERPDGVTEEEWNALGDPGRAALSREREARQAAERALAASRARPTPPKPATQQQPQQPAQQQPPAAQPPASQGGQEVDVAKIVQQAVDAAVKPFREAEQRRDVETAAERVRDAVLAAAKPLLHDETDALTNVDLAGVVNDQGQADPTKVQAALDDLVKRKPHLAKTTQRVAPPGIGGGAPAAIPDADRVKAVLTDMQRATGVRIPSTT